MAHYYSVFPKRHIAWGNSQTIGKLDLGVLCRAYQKKLASLGKRSAKTYRSGDGKKRFVGTVHLKTSGSRAWINVFATHCNPLTFALASYLPCLCHPRLRGTILRDLVASWLAYIVSSVPHGLCTRFTPILQRCPVKIFFTSWIGMICGKMVTCPRCWHGSVAIPTSSWGHGGPSSQQSSSCKDIL